MDHLLSHLPTPGPHQVSAALLGRNSDYLYLVILHLKQVAATRPFRRAPAPLERSHPVDLFPTVPEANYRARQVLQSFGVDPDDSYAGKSDDDDSDDEKDDALFISSAFASIGSFVPTERLSIKSRARYGFGAFGCYAGDGSGLLDLLEVDVEGQPLVYVNERSGCLDMMEFAKADENGVRVRVEVKRVRVGEVVRVSAGDGGTKEGLSGISEGGWKQLINGTVMYCGGVAGAGEVGGVKTVVVEMDEKKLKRGIEQVEEVERLVGGGNQRPLGSQGRLRTC
ncbi:hypothetical protein BJ508DRAFT_410395 [Ascobolus immersus RN42]|uniref:Uncharacterized protein n=1 Tax=Ascobolus immersus RN42 TaxID=1160509 RepID=A0A3N4IQD0_ASCIM|nr:hypothetical protein BJ508DRAFT_410395 [Ascobolus immersus RN42]